MYILYYDQEHENEFLTLLSSMKSHDEYHKAAAYLLTLDRLLKNHITDVFDINQDIILHEGLSKAWQTGTSKKTTRLLFNLWNSFMHENTEDKFYREHVTSYVTHHQDEFRIGSLALDGEDYSKVRITVDTINDYTLSCVITDFIRDKKDRYSFRTVLDCFREHPYISNINADIMQKQKYDTPEEEIAAAVKMLRLQEMDRAAAILEKNN